VDFASFFSEEEIIKVLCNLRISAARKRRRQHLSYNISRTAKNKPGDIQKCHAELKALYMMLPPRRLWNFRRPKNRQNRPSASINKKAILAISLDRNNPKYSGEWSQNLDYFIEEVREKIFGINAYQFESPKVTPIKKNPHLREDRSYRPVSTYTKLIDQVVDKLCAKYFRHLFDPTFLDCSYAFRTAGEGKPSPTHHDAVKKLVEFRELNSKEILWIAECDIQKFFDCVNHDKVLKAIEEVEASNHIQIDSRAKIILEAYLHSYSFPKTAKSHCTQFFRERGIDGQVEWCQTELAMLYEDPSQENIGVPQGGAISCFIVNLLLDFADRQVLGSKKDPALLYIRYCDDIIIAHTSKKGCDEALERYLEALRWLLLIPHRPKTIKQYGKEFFQVKSKHPYVWGDDLSKGNIPWISFLGYQIKHDGTVKIRPSSIYKELRKQVEEADRTLKLVFPRNQNKDLKIRRSRSQILHSLQQKMISMSVGRVKKYREERELASPQDFCWCGGFKLLATQEKAFIEQLRALDRGRERQLNRVKRKLNELPKIDAESPTHKALKYYGNPFSYYNQFFKGKN
jgi:retron-type reverse transcriptase